MWHVVSPKPDASRFQLTLNERHGWMALEEPPIKRYGWSQLKLFESVTEDEAEALVVAGQMKLDVPILPNAWRATSARSAADDDRLAKNASEIINRVAKAHRAKLS